MSRAAPVLAATVLVAACANAPPAPPAPEPAPAVVTEEPAPAAPESAPEAAPAEATPAEATPPALPRPEQTADGPYKVSVASERTTAETTPWVRKLEAEDYRVEVEPAQVGDTTWQRVVLPGLRNGREARAMAAYVAQQFGVAGAWVLPKNVPAGEAAAPAPAEKPPVAAGQPEN